MADSKNSKVKEKNQNIQVFVRVRPLNASEKASKSSSIVDTSLKEVVVNERPADKITKKFTFDKVFGVGSEQVDVYKTVVNPLIAEVLAGYNCTVFAYGQTGTGKTFTMEGEPSRDPGVSWDNDPLAGIIPRTLSNLFDELRILQAEYTVRVTYLELYNEELFDLLSTGEDNKIKLFEDVNKKGAVIISGLEEVTVHNKNQVYDILKKGSIKRQTAPTLMNAQSSRSHSVFSITVHIKENSHDGEELLKTGKMNLVDLAGSECVGRSGAVDKRAREAGNINQSLLTLGRCITSLVERTPHVPFRESKLTRLLQDSLGGKTKTSIIATISPAAINLEETLSTLDYAHRAKNITNRPEINQKLNKKALLREYTEEIDRLRKDLAASRDKNGVYLATENYDQMISQLEAQEKENIDLISNMKALNTEKDKMDELCKQLGISLDEQNIALIKTSEELVGTKEHLMVTRKDRDEQRHLVEKHKETEEKLSGEALSLLTLADESTTDTYRLHDSLLRKKSLEMHNINVAHNFRQAFAQSVDSMDVSLQAFLQEQEQYCVGLKKNTDDHCVEEKVGLDAISGLMSSLVNHLNEQMLAMQAKALNQGQSSQHWIQQEMISSRSQSDSEANELHRSLVDLTPMMHSLAVQVQRLQVNKDDFSRYLALQLPRQREILENHRADLIQSFALLQETYASLNRVHLVEINHLKKIAVDYQEQQQVWEDEELKYSDMLRARQAVRKEYTEKVAEAVSRFAVSTAGLATTVADSIQKVSKDLEKFNIELQAKVGDLQDGCTQFVDKTSTFIIDTERIKTNMETEFNDAVRSGINGWKENYSRIEQSLRTRSEEINSELQDQQINIQEVLTVASVAANAHEAALEEQQGKMNSYVRRMVSKIDTQCGQALSWGSKMAGQLQNQNQQVGKFVSMDLQTDKPSGGTPARKEFTYPRDFAATSPHARILARYRALNNRVDADSSDTSHADSNMSSPPSIVINPTESDAHLNNGQSGSWIKSASTSNLFDSPEIPVDLNSSIESEPSMNENKENTLKPLGATKAPSASDPCLKRENAKPGTFVRPAVKKVQQPIKAEITKSKKMIAPKLNTKKPLTSQNKS